MQGGFVVLDFGSQYTQLIARRLRELGVYSELLAYDTPLEEIKRRKPDGIIISGGPNSVADTDAPKCDVRALIEMAPVLGVCYGMQLLVSELGGTVEAAKTREYGYNEIEWKEGLGEVPLVQKVWMSHGDVVKDVPPNFEVIAKSSSNHPAALKGPRVLAFQFHPEVAHTEHGLDLLEYYVREFCQAPNDWDAPHITDHLLDEIKKLVPKGEKVLCALSGGVDSTVVGTLLTKALGHDQVHCVFVDTGLLRKDEFEEVLTIYDRIGLNVHGIKSKDYFLGELKGASDPETKRKIIGRCFIDVFKQSVKEMEPVQWLAQGTLYPDVIESVSLRGQSVTIKSHHNVGGLPKDLNLKLVEPLRELFKDEVRAIGKELGIPQDILWRHPFPGPGLAIRILGEITEEAVATLQECDAIYINALKEEGLYDKIWQAFGVLLPVKTVGVQGDSRTYQKVLSLRAVTSTDGMTADWFDFPPKFLRKVSNQITNDVKSVNRVVYDVTSKPPGTIEWE